MIQLKDITKVYHVGEIDLPVLKGISLTIEDGEFVSLTGASGSGKSTLMNLLGCLDRPSSGEYWIDGKNVANLNANQRAALRNERIGFVFQNFNLLPRTAAFEQVELPDLYLGRLSRRERYERAVTLLRRVGLGGRIRHTPAQMSGGQQQRVAIARALMNDPPVLFADEPTGNLDTKSSIEIMNLFTALSEEGITIIMVTHEDDIAAYAKRHLVMKDGRLVKDDGGAE